jgi:pyruvate formate lyase activating enzyme
MQTRRQFLKAATAAAAACAAPRALAGVLSTPELREARFYDALADGLVRCTLCPFRCTVPDGRRGNCGVRENRGGKYYTLVYGRPVSMHNDPIEKKPFVHVYPGSKTFSIATVGCNFHCKFCQNWEISQANPDDVSAPYVSPAQIAQRAVEAGSKTVAYTYSEPSIFYEYMFDCCTEAKTRGLGNVLISNGFINDEPGRKLLEQMTAVKIDLKSFSPDFYRNLCAGELEPVLSTLKRVRDAGVWLEIVVLLIPTLNDGDDELRRMAGWILKELGPDVPLNFIRFHPLYKLRNLPPTPRETLQKAHDIAVGEGLNFVYATECQGTTRCPKCRHGLVERTVDALISNRMSGPKCPKCGTAIPGVWV